MLYFIPRHPTTKVKKILVLLDSLLNLNFSGYQTCFKLHFSPVEAEIISNCYLYMHSMVTINLIITKAALPCLALQDEYSYDKEHSEFKEISALEPSIFTLRKSPYFFLSPSSLWRRCVRFMRTRGYT